MGKYKTQIAIIGGGITGLWLVNLLRSRGYEALLFEKAGLGGEQTFASQGMIHGGLKYALGGMTTPASESIADMPEVWRRCLAGDGDVDLSGLSILSEDYFLFSDAALSSKVTAFFASKSLEARISAIKRKDFTGIFRSPKFKGRLYRLQDIVLDTPALVTKLMSNYQDFIFQCGPKVLLKSKKIVGLQLSEGDVLEADCYIFAAGAGNEDLLKETSLENISMQRRPVQQVMVKGKLPKIYAHAVSLQSTNKPRVTFTSHPSDDGETVWYLGGNLAEKGVGKTAEEVIRKAKSELGSLLPWVDLTNTAWATLNIDRAEPSQRLKTRPEFPFVEAKDNALVCWPTKLTLCPMLGQDVLQIIENKNLPKSRKEKEALPNLPLAPVAQTPWEIAFG
ncbi:MAG: glycerol-3-phosphate dehydrogenase [Flavobacterium sp.]|jgi:glycerol-3-phosphate dehydrogenase